MDEWSDTLSQSSNYQPALVETGPVRPLTLGLVYHFTAIFRKTKESEQRFTAEIRMVASTTTTSLFELLSRRLDEEMFFIFFGGFDGFDDLGSDMI